MKIIVAKTAGFCEGVDKAVHLAEEASAGGQGKVYTLGPLVHNPQVIRMLEERGVHMVSDPAGIEALETGTVLIRSHGIPPDLRERLVRKGLKLCDATCRRVARVHGLVQRYHARGFFIVVLGDPGHAEVEGILGYAPGRAVVIQGADQVTSLPEADKVCLVSQTTQDRQVFAKVVQALRRRYPGLREDELVIHDTICNSTRDRQEEVRRMAPKVEALVVVGGKDSANTARLAQVARQCGIPAFHVETEDELDLAQLSKFNVVGITAGASTPEWMITRVKETLEKL